MLNRRNFSLGALAAVAGAPALAQVGARPIKLIVGFGPGTGPDVISRLVAERMTKELGQPVIVDNKAGGEGIIAAEAATHAAPDGTTLYFGSGHSLIGTPILRAGTVPYDPFKDFTPVCQMGLFTLAVVTAPGVPANNFAEFLDYVRAHPHQLNFATSSINNRVTSLQLVAQYKLDMIHVPYKSETLGLTDLMANRVHLQSASLAAGLPGFAKAGKLKVLFVQRSTRSSMLPDVPTVKEAGADIKISPWSGLFGPAGMPRALAERYAQAYKTVVAAGDLRERFDQLGFEPVPSTPDELAAIHRTEYEVFKKVVAENNIKFD